MLKIKEYLKSNMIVIIFILSSLINTTLLRFVTINNYLEVGPLLIDLFTLIIIASFSCLFNEKGKYRYLLTWTIIINIILVINSMYYTNYKSFASISFLKTSFEIVDVKDAVFKNVMEIKDFSYLWQIIVFIVLKKKVKKNNFDKKTKLLNFRNVLLSSILILILSLFTLNSTKLSRLNNQYNRPYILKNYGLIVYQCDDIFQTIAINIKGNKEYNKAKKNMINYFDSKEKHIDNQYTNLLKDKNVIIIHAESIQGYTLNLKLNNKEVTPNLNRLAKEGIYFSNFYAQESVGTSSDTEFTFNTSLMPTSYGTAFISYYENNYISLPKIMKNDGYNTYSMHGNKCDFWNREAMHNTLGYNHFYCYSDAYDIDEVIGLGLSDKSFFNQSVNIIKNNNDKFYATLIMLSNHTPFDDIEKINDFDVSDTYIIDGVEYKDEFLENSIIGNYLKSVNYADQAIGEFINKLDSEGLLDNTVVIIYGDHDSKLKQEEYEKYLNYKDGVYLSKNDSEYIKFSDYKYELNRKVPFIIWSKDEEYNLEVDKVMGMIDVMPTLLNMFGKEGKYVLGNDIFSDNEGIVVFPTGNWLTNSMYYNYTNDEGILLDSNIKLEKNYITNHNKYASKVISISNDIVTFDLLKDINN